MLLNALDEWFPGADRPVKTIVFADLVESVRLMEEHEEQTIQRWLQLVARIKHELLPAHGGRLVKSTGDGVMLEFAAARPAIQASLALQTMVLDENARSPGAVPLAFRIGAHTTPVVIGANDVFGKGVNLAARLMTLAGPNEIVVSPEVRDALTADLDADIEDLGECYLKHVSLPIRTYRIGAAGPKPIITTSNGPANSALKPSIAVIPFSARTHELNDSVVGEVLADDIISSLSRTAALQVISRLSTTAFRDRTAQMEEIGGRLGATYVLSGHYRISSGKVRVMAELADARTSHVIWAESLMTEVAAVLAGESDLVPDLIAAIGRVVMTHQLERAQSLPLPSLESYTLLMGAISLMHRTQASDFAKSRQMLEYLAERHNRSPLPLAWLAKWQVLEVVQGWSSDRDLAGSKAMQVASEALNRDPNCSLALAVAGLVHTYLLGDLQKGGFSYDQALAINPNESLAWLFKSTWQSYVDQPQAAANSGELALQLSPIDPLRYFYDSLAATAMTAAGRYDRAIQLARRSLRANRTHASTHRILTIALSLNADHGQATEAARELLLIEPGLTSRSFLARYPGRGAAHAALYAEALIRAGIPQ